MKGERTMERYRGQWMTYEGRKMAVVRELTDCFYAPAATVYKCSDGNFYQAGALRPSVDQVELLLIVREEYPRLYENY
jgi:hypothetical protein